ncbi:microtubule-associated protein Jupiter-like isoform X2 [Bradysia coprophila]|uniref:microtubule-associated protein Jupiter-like isoform X2 n=1 Tax=Bradysia coprophila TaxID=38358 RepID=UPI00187D8C8A|nr:microtubule-associated protein Jupiter-like isoform X2 [Bradysia coprophila]
MTSTNIQIGLSENSRNSSKVLKPPGGGSSDIFGHANGNTAATPRSNKGHMASNIFAPPLAKSCNDRQGEYRYFFIGDNHRRNPNMDSHNRLFGEVERPYTPAKNHQKSSIPLGGADSVDSTPRTNGTNGTKANGTNGHTNGNGHSNGEAMVANGNSVKHVFLRRRKPITSPNNSYSSSIQEEILSPRSPAATTPRRKLNAPLDNLPIQPIEIDTHVHFNGANGPLTNTTNSSSFSSSTDDSNYGFVKSPRLTPRNPVTGMGVQDSFHRGRRMDGRRDGNPVTGHGYSTEINTAVPALNGGSSKPAVLNGTNQVINKNRIPPGGFSSGLW